MLNYTPNPLAAMMASTTGGGPGAASGAAIGGQLGATPPATPPPTLIPVKDRRKVLAATGIPFSDKYSKAGSFDQTFMQNIVKAAKHNGVDPNMALAVALQETHMGKTPISDVIHQVFENAPAGLDQGSYELTKMLKQKMAEGQKLGFKDEAHQIQMFNGMGKLKPTMKINGVSQPMSYYGLKVTEDNPLDMRKNPVYGKTIQDLRDNVIKQSPELQDLINKTTL